MVPPVAKPAAPAQNVKRASKGATLRKGKRRGDDDEHGYSSRKDQALQKPPDQEKLTPDQLKEEIIRSLAVCDPLRAKDVSVWDFNEKSFVPLVLEDQMVTLFYLPSEVLFKESDEIREFKGELIDDVSDPEEEEKVEEASESSKVPIIPKIGADKPVETKEKETKEEPKEEVVEKKEEILKKKSYIAPALRGQSTEGSGGSLMEKSRERDDANTIRVSNLAEEVEEYELREMFAQAGLIQRCFLGRDKDTGISKGFAFITYKFDDSVDIAISKFDGKGLNHMILSVERSKPKPK